MKETLKRHLISILITFVSSFLTLLGASIATMGTENLTSAIIGSLILSAARGAVKAIYERYATR